MHILPLPFLRKFGTLLCTRLNGSSFFSLDHVLDFTVVLSVMSFSVLSVIFETLMIWKSWLLNECAFDDAVLRILMTDAESLAG
jgi:hypothetical protein